MNLANLSEKIKSIFLHDFFSSLNSELKNRNTELLSNLSKVNSNLSSIKTPSSLKEYIITNIPPEGIIIDVSGEYKFGNDIIWSPNNSCTAITINADNVTLDLNQFILSVNPSTFVNNNGAQFNGISVLESTNIVIQNGSIDKVSYYGVNISKSLDIKIDNITIGNINYIETSKKDLTPCGIFIESTDGFYIQNSIVQNVSVTAPSCAGIQVIKSNDGKVSNCRLEKFLNNDGGVQGFSYISSTKILTQNCTCENFQSHYQGITMTTGHTVIGYVPIFCDQLEFNDCSSTSMTGCCDDCHGMSVFLDTNVVVNNFRALKITDGVTPRNTGAKATGLEVYGSNIIINNCKAKDIKAIIPQDLQSAGFSAWGNNITFNDCVADNVTVTDAEGTPSASYGYGIGFGWAPDPRSEFNEVANNVKYNNCTTYNCQIGFDTWYHTNSNWNEVMSHGGEIFILVQPNATRTLSMDQCSESPNGKYQQVSLTNRAKNNTYPMIKKT
ncbi:right-handed parallel beta-helix repeat-containing protein [Mesonia sp. K4-1]|uniref:right-handed parallel beta-helix repeat-containing protein n=1 Tax=Mesonia sp. K4-1 TaxID=2602760 RepID=UPI0011CA0109|nr:right-handed parallel beta-helix repeat-containing protein [Mesonia sp. K4-1]TXK71950.1 hypothetical protein FT986_14945 [Mesonia sp. K4-1]